jgi:hypothetical protein
VATLLKCCRNLWVIPFFTYAGRLRLAFGAKKSPLDQVKSVDGKQAGLRKDHAEGYTQAKWVLVDYGDIVVHIFAAEEREYYDIESLWRETAVKLERDTK